MTRLTTAELEAAISTLEALSRDLATAFTRHPPGWVRRLRRRIWQRAAALRQCYVPARRASAARLAVQALTVTLQEMRTAGLFTPPGKQEQWLQAELYRTREQLTAAKAQVAALTAEHERLAAQLERQPHQTVAVIPQQTVRVTSPVQQAVLQLMGSTGLSRPWRISALLQARCGYSDGALNNAFSRLLRPTDERPALLALYEHQGRKVRYRYLAYSRRNLYVLTPAGETWYRVAYPDTPLLPNELPAAAAEHHGVEHAVDILEARDIWQACGLAVQEHPPAMHYTDEIWGPRSEPDLLVQLAGRWCPVEVQREVRRTHTAKWHKALQLSGGRLVLVLESSPAQARQVQFLRPLLRTLPAGEIWLTNLETLRTLASVTATELPWERLITG